MPSAYRAVRRKCAQQRQAILRTIFISRAIFLNLSEEPTENEIVMVIFLGNLLSSQSKKLEAKAKRLVTSITDFRSTMTKKHVVAKACDPCPDADIWIQTFDEIVDTFCPRGMAYRDLVLEPAAKKKSSKLLKSLKVDTAQPGIPQPEPKVAYNMGKEDQTSTQSPVSISLPDQILHQDMSKLAANTDRNDEKNKEIRSPVLSDRSVLPTVSPSPRTTFLPSSSYNSTPNVRAAETAQMELSAMAVRFSARWAYHRWRQKSDKRDNASQIVSS